MPSCKHKASHLWKASHMPLCKCICRWWGHSDARSCTMKVGVCPHLVYAGGGDTQMQGLAPWRWGYALVSYMQVVGTLRCKVLHHGVGIPLYIYARPHICRWWGHSNARSCTMKVGVCPCLAYAGGGDTQMQGLAP